MSKTRTNTTVIEGIQAGGNVSAGAMAVGHHAHAENRVASGDARAELEGYITELEEALTDLLEDKQQIKALGEELSALRGLVVSPAPQQKRVESVLERFVAKLKMTHVALSETAAIVGPLTTIAKALSIPLKFLGIG
jgi:hypothetical protein